MMDLDKSYVNRLLYFYFVASCRNISQAAREAGLHQSALSRQMIKLEKEVGMPLMKRHKNGVTLTRKGEELFEFARKIFSEVQASRKQLDEKGDISGKIRISTTYGIANYILANYLLEFNKIYPEIFFDVICNDQAIDLVKNDVDVAIRPYDSHSENIIQSPLFKLQGKLYASREYIEKNGFPESEHHLKNHKFIAYSWSENIPSYYPTDWFLSIEGCTTEKNCIMRSNSIEFIYKAVQNGFGIASGHQAMEIINKYDFINVAPQLKGPEYNAYFIHSKKTAFLNRLEIFKTFLKTKIAT